MLRRQLVTIYRQLKLPAGAADAKNPRSPKGEDSCKKPRIYHARNQLACYRCPQGSLHGAAASLSEIRPEPSHSYG